MFRWLLACALIATFRPAAAQTLDFGSADYQRRLVTEASKSNHLELEPEPEGKLIERIVTVPYDAITPDEPFPQFLNWFHVTTLPEVVERELLFRVGDRWSNDRVAESARNLRNYLFLTSGRIVACKGSTPDQVVALVVTKDMWSLRPNIDFTLTGTQFQTFESQLTEQNVAGRMKRATLDFGFDIPTYFGGLQYQDPRLLGSELNMLQQGGLIWNRSTHVLEGGVGVISLQQPLYTLDTPWAWTATANYRKDIYRLYSAGQLVYFADPATGQEIPYSFNRHTLDFQAGLTRSLGHDRKRNFSFGYRGFVHEYSTPPSPGSPATFAAFQNSVVPLSESAGMLYAGFETYEARYRELLDIQSFAVSEDVRLGLDFSAEARVAAPEFGFSSTFFEPVLNLSWASYRYDNLFNASGSFDVRYQPELDPGGSPWADGVISATVHNVSPRYRFARLHTSLRAGRRFNDYNHVFTTLGGDQGLRGYPSQYFIGSNFWVGNFEVRTDPLKYHTLHIGAAAFCDVGAAANQISQLTPNASVGGGLRIGVPQFNRDVIRLDFGWPLETLSTTSTAYFVAQFGQAF